MEKTFYYKARNLEGEQRAGVMVVEDQRQLQAALREDGFFITQLQEQKPKTKASFLSRGPSLKDLASLSRQLSVMIHAGLSLTSSLRLCAQQTENQALSSGLSQVLSQVEEGQALSTSFGQMPALFPPLFVHMVEAGENGGTLDLMLERLATYYEREYQLEQKIRSAMLYPIVVCLLAVVVLAVLIFFILPQFAGIFADFQVPIPTATQFLLDGAAFLTRFWLPILLVFLGIVLGFFAYIQTAQGKQWWDRVSLKLPLIGQLLNWTYTSRLARTLSTLVRGGTQILLALEITGKVVGNTHFQEAIRRAESRVEQGEDLATPLEEAQLLPALFLQLLKVGEETGALDEMLGQAADFYEEEVENTAQNLTSLLEPAIVIILGVVVGGLLVTTILPLYDLVSGMTGN